MKIGYLRQLPRTSNNSMTLTNNIMKDDLSRIATVNNTVYFKHDLSNVPIKNNPILSKVVTLRNSTNTKIKKLYEFADGSKTMQFVAPGILKVKKFKDGVWKLVRFEATGISYSSGKHYTVTNGLGLPHHVKVKPIRVFADSFKEESLRYLSNSEKLKVLGKYISKVIAK